MNFPPNKKELEKLIGTPTTTIDTLRQRGVYVVLHEDGRKIFASQGKPCLAAIPLWVQELIDKERILANEDFKSKIRQLIGAADEKSIYNDNMRG